MVIRPLDRSQPGQGCCLPAPLLAAPVIRRFARSCPPSPMLDPECPGGWCLGIDSGPALCLPCLWLGSSGVLGGSVFPSGVAEDAPRQRSGPPTGGVCLERGPAFRLARKNFPHGRSRLSSEGPERTRRTRGSGLTAVGDRARGERHSERSERLQGFARILTNGGESHRKNCRFPDPAGVPPSPLPRRVAPQRIFLFRKEIIAFGVTVRYPSSLISAGR